MDLATSSGFDFGVCESLGLARALISNLWYKLDSLGNPPSSITRGFEKASLKPTTQMIHHIVLFKSKDRATKPEIKSALDKLESLLGEVNEVKDFRVAKLFPHRSNRYNYVQFSVFTDLNALDKYRHHSEHEEVKLALKKVFDYVVINYEV